MPKNLLKKPKQVDSESEKDLHDDLKPLKKKKIKKIVLPFINAKEAAFVKETKVFGIKTPNRPNR